MLSLLALFAATLFLSYANGANDNFKGVATLYGSNVASYRTSLIIGTSATLAGSLASLFVAQSLIIAFSGRGLVPDASTTQTAFAVSVAIAAAGTVMLATVFGFPISTTHALVGGIAGAGFGATGSELNFGSLGASFVAPLLISPILAVVATVPVYWGLHRVRISLGVSTQSCICVRPGHFIANASTAAIAAPSPALIQVKCGTVQQCVEKYDGAVMGFSIQKFADAIHYLSACAISFARGLNDTPKILGLLFAVQVLDLQFGVFAIAAAMAIGGLINAKRVAETMSKRVTRMNDGQALSANLVTACLVIFATRWGVPVSTTHVSVGAITGVGLVRGDVDWKVLSSILLAWCLTLPIAAVTAHICYSLITLIP
jgi:PiT family inorganic phosphate transporter